MRPDTALSGQMDQGNLASRRGLAGLSQAGSASPADGSDDLSEDQGANQSKGTPDDQWSGTSSEKDSQGFFESMKDPFPSALKLPWERSTGQGRFERACGVGCTGGTSKTTADPDLASIDSDSSDALNDEQAQDVSSQRPGAKPASRLAGLAARLSDHGSGSQAPGSELDSLRLREKRRLEHDTVNSKSLRALEQSRK